jgi:hypothetical protein
MDLRNIARAAAGDESRCEAISGGGKGHPARAGPACPLQIQLIRHEPKSARLNGKSVQLSTADIGGLLPHVRSGASSVITTAITVGHKCPIFTMICAYIRPTLAWQGSADDSSIS